MVYSVLEATLRLYIRDKREQIPVIAMLSRTEQGLDAAGSAWLKKLQERFPQEEWTLQSTTNYLGGGVAPMKGLPSRAISLRVHSDSPEVVARVLRNCDPSILTRIEEERILFELRTLSVSDLQEIFSVLETIL